MEIELSLLCVVLGTGIVSNIVSISTVNSKYRCGSPMSSTAPMPSIAPLPGIAPMPTAT